MADSPLGLHQVTPAELRERLAAERRGVPFLVYRDGVGGQRLIELSHDRARVTLGRSEHCDVALAWDSEVSRLHAELERVGDQWLVIDDGLSTNGTFVGDMRVTGRRRLADGDSLRIGDTIVAYRDPGAGSVVATSTSDDHDVVASVTDAQRRVVVALCRPFKGGAVDVTPATNPQIAAELFLTVAAVKMHLRSLCRTFAIDDLPQQQKRRRLVALAFSTGLVSDRDL